MKKLVISLVTVAALSLTLSAHAGTINPGDNAECNNAQQITLEASGTSNAGDRTNANAVVWKSANATTVPITLGSGEHQGFSGDGHVGMSDKHSMGAGKVVLKKQTAFSRGDSIGDISGLVRITNTGTIPINVTCG